MSGSSGVCGSAEDARLLALAGAGRRLAGVTCLDDLAAVAAELTLSVLGGDSASVLRVEPDHGRVRVLRNTGALAGWEEEEPEDEVYDLAAFPWFATPFEEVAPLVTSLGDARPGRREPAEHALLRSMGMHTFLTVPVLLGQRVWGALSAARTADRPPFARADQAAGEALCGLVTAAVARITDRAELHELAYLDPLTGLGNRRAVDDRLEALFATEPLARPVAVVVADVDGLKRVNDDHGHALGDRLLRDVAGLLARCAGRFETALAARLGGDEFCLVVEGTTAEEVQEAVDQLVDAVTALPLGGGLSCGVAVATERPADARSASAAARAVLRLADAAQYRAKRARSGASVDVRTEPVVDDEVGARIADRAVRALATAGDDIVDRVATVCLIATTELDLAGWAVSLSVDRGPVVIVRNDDRRLPETNGDQPFDPGTGYDLDDYPATAAALLGGSFHATLDVGDRSEREFLASNGYDQMVAVGVVQDERHAWLVELFTDAMSAPLVPHRGLLHALMELAAAPLHEPATPVVRDAAR